MSKGSRLGSGQGVTRRGFTAGALGAGLILGSGRAPAIAQGKRDLRVGVWGGEFGNLSPVIRYDIQGGLVALQHLRRPGGDQLRQAHHRADAGARMVQSRSADLAHQAARGREVAEGLRRVHRRGRRLHAGTSISNPRASRSARRCSRSTRVKADGKYVVEVKTKQPFGAFPGVTMGYGGTIISAKAHKEMGNQAY